MIENLWRNFPRLLERNINGLLDSAEPNPTKAFMIYKTCKFEGLWSGTFEQFNRHLREFYSHHRGERRKSQFDRFLDRPMDQDVFGYFDLNFRTAVVSDVELHNLANWTHNLIRVGKKTNSAVISISILEQTLRRLTKPGPFEKEENILFDDFCGAWQKTVFNAHGNRYASELGEIVNELKRMDAQLKLQANEESSPMVSVHLSQVEMDWVLAVRSAVHEDTELPRFPGIETPDKPPLKELERLMSLYRIVQTTTLRELFKHKERICKKLLYQCDHLLAESFSQSS